jgi:hypothetical protein
MKKYFLLLTLLIAGGLLFGSNFSMSFGPMYKLMFFSPPAGPIFVNAFGGSYNAVIYMSGGFTLEPAFDLSFASTEWGTRMLLNPSFGAGYSLNLSDEFVLRLIGGAEILLGDLCLNFGVFLRSSLTYFFTWNIGLKLAVRIACNFLKASGISSYNDGADVIVKFDTLLGLDIRF